jgi:hypothetical protein
MNNQFYMCEKYYIFIFDTKYNAIVTSKNSAGGSATPRAAIHAAAYWSKELNSRVTYSDPGEPIFVLKKDGEFWNVIVGEKIGWIVVVNWMKIKQLEKNNGTK